MQKNSKIFVAGHRGMVGSAIVRKLQSEGFNSILFRTSKELDLRNQRDVADFFNYEKPEYVFLAAAKVGGIVANNTYRADFIYENLIIECNVIKSAFDSGVKKLLFLGSSCIYPKMAPQPLKEENLEYWRGLIGYVKQDIFMIDSNIKENVAFGEETINNDLLNAAIKQASLNEFVGNLPKGVESEVGERGSRLSGGQKQRIGIARSLYRNAQILVFDEATSALDTQTEREVSEAIDSLSDTNKTIFIIAHRVTTLKNCDRIYELKNGEIAGVYSYSELIEKVI